LGYERPRAIDLHIHSSASDGTLAPEEILSRAARLGLGAISITDHDTVAGCRQAQAAPAPPGLRFLTGIEISSQPPVEFGLPGSLHILGYGIDICDSNLLRALDTLQDARRQRLPKMIRRLRRLGCSISDEEIRQAVGSSQPGRPHLARALVGKGLVKSIDEAFERYLGNGRPAYVQKYRLPWRRTIAVIRGAGGIAVLAHPGLIPLPSETDLETLVQRLVGAGLGGIECYYPQHPAEATARYRRMARKHHLVVTGGTDFHGDQSAGIQIGSGKGGFCVPYELYQALADRLATRGAP
jgi:predicted metal-dependent phosphoesterase TrpH